MEDLHHGAVFSKSEAMVSSKPEVRSQVHRHKKLFDFLEKE
jgi:hypothetical protein